MRTWGRKVFNTLGAGIQILSSSGDAFASDPHSRVHQGKFFSCGYMDTAVASDADLDLILTTPANQFPHLRIAPAVAAEAEFYFYEGVSFADDGIAVPVYNHKRYSSRTFGGAVVAGPTINSINDLLHEAVLPGGSQGAGTVGSAHTFDEEWMLKGGEDYLIRLTNRSNAAERLSIGLSFYYTSVQIPDA